MIDFSVIFYVLAFILWIIGLALTNKKKVGSVNKNIDIICYK